MKKFRGQPKLDEAAGRVQFGCQRNFLNPIISKLDKHVVLLLIIYIASQYVIGHCSVIEDITRRGRGVRGVRKPQNRTEIHQKTANRI